MALVLGISPVRGGASGGFAEYAFGPGAPLFTTDGKTFTASYLRRINAEELGLSYRWETSPDLVQWLWSNPAETVQQVDEIWERVTLTGPVLAGLERAGYARVRASGPAGPEIPESFVLIPAGTFQMGDTFVEPDGFDERPVHAVQISAFYMEKFVVSWALWEEVKQWASGNGYTFETPGFGKAADHPVCRVNWYNVVKWCNARSERDGKAPVYHTDSEMKIIYRSGQIDPFVNWSLDGYRLPTEAEWEKAARGGFAGRRFPWGDTVSHTQANYYSMGWDAYDLSPTRGYHPDYAIGNRPFTNPVGAFAANRYGLYGMAGNVWQWCWDWYQPDYYGVTPPSDPRGSTSGTYRILRAGSWDNAGGSSLRTAERGQDWPDPFWTDTYGFRCVLRDGLR